MRNLQEQVKKAFCYQQLFWPFTVWINYSSDLKKFANSDFSLEFEKFFLITRTIFSHRTILVTKYQCIICFSHPKLIRCRKKNFYILLNAHCMTYFFLKDRHLLKQIIGGNILSFHYNAEKTRESVKKGRSVTFFVASWKIQTLKCIIIYNESLFNE
jgi:hypothetical protein